MPCLPRAKTATADPFALITSQMAETMSFEQATKRFDAMAKAVGINLTKGYRKVVCAILFDNYTDADAEACLRRALTCDRKYWERSIADHNTRMAEEEKRTLAERAPPPTEAPLPPIDEADPFADE